jgi:alpha-galactosidase
MLSMLQVAPAHPNLQILTTWADGEMCNGTQQRRLRAELRNTGREAIHVEAITLLHIPHVLPADKTALYGEGFQMLSQTEGTIQDPIDVGLYTDRGHYKMPAPADHTDIYGLLHLSDAVETETRHEATEMEPQGGWVEQIVFAFVSCMRFSGSFLLSHRCVCACACF